MSDNTPGWVSRTIEREEAKIGAASTSTVYHRGYRARNRRHLQQARVSRYHANPRQEQIWRQNGNDRVRDEIFEHYGEKCAICGSENKEALILARTEDDRDPYMASSGGVAKRYRSIRRDNFPEGYETRCRNCDTLKKRLGRVPASWEIEEGLAEEARRRSLINSLAKASDDDIFGEGESDLIPVSNGHDHADV